MLYSRVIKQVHGVGFPSLLSLCTTMETIAISLKVVHKKLIVLNVNKGIGSD